MLNEIKHAKLVSLIVLAIIFLGLTGSLLSNLLGIEKIHYIFLLPLFLILSYTLFQMKHFVCLCILGLFIPLIFFSFEKNSLVTLFSVFLMPLIFFKAGKKFDLSLFVIGISTLVLFFIVGLTLEYFSSNSDLFPFLGYEINGELKRRYGSFTNSPLALGYFSVCAAVICFLNDNKFIKNIAIAGALTLLYFANSRACFAILLLAIFIYFLINKNYYKITFSTFIALFALFFSPLTPRLFSIFDWTFDTGNIGRIRQWKICVNVISDNFLFGLGPGSFSPFGGDINYFGGIKSCESLPLLIFAEYGFFIFLFYFFMLFKYLYLCLIQFNRHGRKHQFKNKFNILFSLNLAILISQIFNQSIQGIFLGGTFFLLLGYTCRKRI